MSKSRTNVDLLNNLLVLLGGTAVTDISEVLAAVTTVGGLATFTGNTVSAAQPGCFAAYTLVTFNIGQSSVPVDIIYPTEEYDNGGCYNAATGVFTAPIAGRYQVNFSITPLFASGSSAGITLVADMVKNAASLVGRATLQGAKTIAGATTQIGPPMVFSSVMKLAINDALKWRASYSDAVSLSVSALSCGFSVEFLG